MAYDRTFNDPRTDLPTRTIILYEDVSSLPEVGSNEKRKTLNWMRFEFVTAIRLGKATEPENFK